MAGLPKKYMSMKGKTLKQKWAAYRRDQNKRRGSRRSSGGGSRSATGGGSSNKMTVGKALDAGSLVIPGIYQGSRYAIYGEETAVKNALPRMYVGYDFITRTAQPEELIKGYGGAVNRAIEKKVMKALKVRPPRSQISTIGDVLDHASYFGKTAFEVWENKDDIPEAIRQGYKTQYGVDLNGEKLAAYQPLDMFTEKVLPYVAQKYVRKVLRKAGIKFGM